MYKGNKQTACFLLKFGITAAFASSEIIQKCIFLKEQNSIKNGPGKLQDKVLWCRTGYL